MVQRAALVLTAISAAALVACSTTESVGATGKLDVQREELARLERDIGKIDKSIAVTRDLLQTSRGEQYQPDLWFRLAELHIEKSRLAYFRAIENAGADDKNAVLAPEARLLKDEAISIYRRILAEFPDYPDNDKITFFIAHEYRELGNFPEMVRTFEELIDNYPRSSFRHEAWLVLGDYHFDRGDNDGAVLSYRAILKQPEGYAHNMARYKLGWCFINKDKPALAVDLWEQAVRTPTVSELPDVDALTDAPGRLDVRQDALRDLAHYYVEARDPKTAMAFFEELTVSRQEYKAALERLAKRFRVKTMYPESARVYRELVRISSDVDRNLEWAEALYEATVNARDLSHADEDVVMLTEVSARYKYWWRASDADKKVLRDFELLARDLATRLHTLAKEKNDAELFARAATAYAAYLSVFDDQNQRLAMEWNYAETLFAAKRFVKAGSRYEQVLKLLSDGDLASTALGADQKQAMYGAIVSYFEAVKTRQANTRYESMSAREGIKDLGGRFVTSWPDDTNTPIVKFNVARAYFEQGLFDRSIEMFTAFVQEYPQHKDAQVAAELALDAFDQKSDWEGLAKAARAFGEQLGATNGGVKQRFETLAAQADDKRVRKIIIEPPTTGPITAGLDGEALAKLLYLQFASARDSGNIAEMTAKGRELLEHHGQSKLALEVLPSLGERALRASQLENAASLYEEFARRFPNAKGADLLLDGAAQLRSALGEHAAAMADYQRLTQQGAPDQRPAWRARLAEVALAAKDWRAAEDNALAMMDEPATALAGRTIAGEAALRTGRTEVATERLSAAIASGEQGPDASRWLSRAHYLMGEIVRADFERVQIRSGEEATALQQKLGLLEELNATYLEAIKAGDPEWAMGALYRIAHATRHAAETLENAPPLSGASADEQKQYRAALAERAAPLKLQAQAAFDACRAQAKKLDAFNRFSKACVTGASVKDDADAAPARPTGAVIPGRDALEAKLVANPRDVVALAQLIRAAIVVKDHALARALASRGLELEPKSPTLLNLYGVACAGTNDAQGAADSFKLALRYDPKNGAAAVNLATLVGEYGDAARAGELLRAAGVVDRTSVDVIRR